MGALADLVREFSIASPYYFNVLGGAMAALEDLNHLRRCRTPTTPAAHREPHTEYTQLQARVSRLSGYLADGAVRVTLVCAGGVGWGWRWGVGSETGGVRGAVHLHQGHHRLLGPGPARPLELRPDGPPGPAGRSCDEPAESFLLERESRP